MNELGKQEAQRRRHQLTALLALLRTKMPDEWRAGVDQLINEYPVLRNAPPPGPHTPSRTPSQDAERTFAFALNDLFLKLHDMAALEEKRQKLFDEARQLHFKLIAATEQLLVYRKDP